MYVVHCIYQVMVNSCFVHCTIQLKSFKYNRLHVFNNLMIYMYMYIALLFFFLFSIWYMYMYVHVHGHGHGHGHVGDTNS